MSALAAAVEAAAEAAGVAAAEAIVVAAVVAAAEAIVAVEAVVVVAAVVATEAVVVAVVFSQDSAIARYHDYNFLSYPGKQDRSPSGEVGWAGG